MSRFHWKEYAKYHLGSTAPADLTHAGLQQLLGEMQAIRPQGMTVTPLGESVEGRTISLVTLGTGPKRVLAWSQMHGDEPTHTAVLLDLIHFLQRDPEHAIAIEILAGCTLFFIPMLNPDATERWTRRNAQDIDVNRDARHLQSAAGKLLKRAVEELRPKFALNLHNQNPRTAVGDPPRPAAVSLLVPARDAEGTETEQMVDAKRVASCFYRAVAPHCAGGVSRYDADYMPRSFGEWLQQQDVATLLIEAGGWLESEEDPIRQIHFLGIVTALHDIATNAYLQADPAAYEGLPRSVEHDLFDLMFCGATVVNPSGQPAFTADLGVNLPRKQPRRKGILPPGVIEDLGDLGVTGGRQVLGGQGLVCLPGRVVLVPDISPVELPDSAQVFDLLSLGVTTAIGQLDLQDERQLDALDGFSMPPECPLNLAFAISATMPDASWNDELRDRLLRAISLGVVGVVADSFPAEALQYLDWFGVPVFAHDKLAIASAAESPEQTATTAHEWIERLGLGSRGEVRKGAIADLVMLEHATQLGDGLPIDWAGLQTVLVGGNVVLNHGQRVGKTVGSFLRRRWG